MSQRKPPELKLLFLERMKKLLSGEDFKKYLEIIKVPPVKSFRCNTLKIAPEKLKQRLENKGWKISQPWKEHSEVMIVENELEPGELGRALEHLLGYYYIQELASMLPVIALKPKPGERILDLCAAPGSKTTQLASEMKNKGVIFANEISLGRLRILASNLERCGVANVLLTRKEGSAFCNRFLKNYPEFKFDKILIDAPCSGEGTLRSSYQTYIMWNIKTVKSLPRIQKRLFLSAFKLLKKGGEIIYSTCTHAPEENEGVVSDILGFLGDSIEIIEPELPKELKSREGILEWEGVSFDSRVRLCRRIYPQDNDTEGFFIAKFRKVRELEGGINPNEGS